MASISINPDPPKAGQSATIHYKPNAKLILEYTPGGTITVTCDANGDATVKIESGAEALLVTDADDSSVSAGFMVQ